MKLKNLIRIILLVAVLLLLTIVPVNAVISNNGAFDSDYYVNSYEDLKAAYANNTAASYDHFAVTGIDEWRRPSVVFDAAVYLEKNPDVAAVLGNNPRLAYEHFLANGMAEHRVASNEFVVDIYLANYADVKAVYGNNMASVYNQYVYSGIAEGRIANKLVAGAEDHVHELKLTKVISAATCKQDGEGIFACECGKAEERRVIPASADYHDYQLVDTVNGIKISKCSICGDVKTEVPEEAVHTHEYVKVENNGTIPATCTKEGKIFKQCACGDIIEEIVPMKEHESLTPVGEGKITVGVVNCVKDGAEEVTCKVCNQKFIRTISAHKFEKVSESPATCKEEGVITYKCKVCGTTKVETTKKLEHDYRTVTNASLVATCTKPGVELKVCSVCGDTVTKTVAAKGHKKGDEVLRGYAQYNTKGELQPVTVNNASAKATCTQDVAETYTCANGCGEKITAIVEKRLEHRIDTTKPVKEGIIKITGKNVDGTNIYEKDSKGDYVVTTGNVDCTHAKVKVYTCANANCRQTVVVEVTEASKHTPLANSEKVYGATCSKDGYKTYTCTTCNQKIEEPTTEKAGHKYEYVKETCTTPAMIKCSGCASSINPTTESDATLLATAEKLCQAAGLTKTDHDNDSSTPAKYVLPSALNHNFVGATEERADGIYQFCSNCSTLSDKTTWVKRSGLTVKSAKVLKADANKTPIADQTEKAAFEANMAKISKVTVNGNTITVDAQEMTPYKGGAPESACWYAIVVDLGIAKANLTTVADGYQINPEDKDLSNWMSNAGDNEVILWLKAEDMTDGATKKITFVDSSTGATRTITIEMTTVSAVAPGV